MPTTWKDFVGVCLLLVVMFLIGTSRAHLDEVGSANVGSGAMQEKIAYCTSWARFAGRVYDGRSFGIPQEHFLGVLLIAASPDAEGVKVLTYVIGQSYNWPTADDRLQGWIYTRCMKGWPADDIEPEAKPEAEPESQNQAEPMIFGASSQGLVCTNRAEFALQVHRDIQEYGFKQIHVATEEDRLALKDMQWCALNKRDVKGCVLARCMGDLK